MKAIVLEDLYSVETQWLSGCTSTIGVELWFLGSFSNPLARNCKLFYSVEIE